MVLWCRCGDEGCGSGKGAVVGGGLQQREGFRALVLFCSAVGVHVEKQSSCKKKTKTRCAPIL